MATPGHTASCISVLVQTKDGVIAITGKKMNQNGNIDFASDKFYKHVRFKMA